MAYHKNNNHSNNQRTNMIGGAFGSGRIKINQFSLFYVCISIVFCEFQQIVNAAYSEADDLINELDRPS